MLLNENAMHLVTNDIQDEVHPFFEILGSSVSCFQLNFRTTTINFRALFSFIVIY